jgi:hypothetical protein
MASEIAFDGCYVSKLARLDDSSAEPGETNPVEEALRALLKSLKALTPAFDVILLDSRAGLHDLAGLSLHGLAHVDVLVFRGTAQNLAGEVMGSGARKDRAIWMTYERAERLR